MSSVGATQKTIYNIGSSKQQMKFATFAKNKDMHELSIASSIIEIAEDEVKKADAQKVLEIDLDIGLLGGVVIEAMEFAMDVAVKNTVLEDAKVIINQIPGMAKCQECGKEHEVEDLFSPCPNCNSYRNEIISGRELRIGSLIVE